MAKINVVKSEDEKELEELISSVSQFSNTQSRVSPVDLRSRNPQLQKIKNQVKARLLQVETSGFLRE